MVFKQPFGQQRRANNKTKEMATLRFNNCFKNYGMNMGCLTVLSSVGSAYGGYGGATGNDKLVSLADVVCALRLSHDKVVKVQPGKIK